MIALFTDETGRVYLAHYKPEILSASRLADAVQVTSLPPMPVIEDGMQAYLKIVEGSPQWFTEPKPMTEGEKNTLAVTLASRLIIKEKVVAGAVDEETIANVALLFPLWRESLVVKVGDVLQWDGTLVECIQAHTTQTNWTPGTSPSLWKVHRTPSVIVEAWVQPLGAQDAYQLGDMVTHNGSTWESTAADNVWEPGVYGWVVI